MARKSALVVDDSKSARVILSRMLEKYDIDVDMAESAEQAIEYLNHHRPDAIFMDQLMPGMDGLQAVKVIKSNPLTATIPIMMYTSQEGELYVGQARALGAMGVLPKQVRPVDVSKVLYELHLLPDRRELGEPALVPVEIGSDGITARPTDTAGGMGANAAAELQRRLETFLQDQSLDLRRFIVANLEGIAARIAEDMRHAMPLMQPVAPVKRRSWPWVAALLGVGSVAAACAVFAMLSQQNLLKSRSELAALESANAELHRSSEGLATTVKDLTAALAASIAASAPAGGGGNPAVRVEPVPYGEIPFDRSRLEVFRDFLGKLEAQGFHGVVKVSSAAGLFCLTGNSADGYAPAIATLPVNKCDLVGNPYDESLTSQQRQSLAFANLISSVRQRSQGAINVAVDDAGSGRVVAPYPPHSDSLTAGEWNRAAAANNRVEFSAEASP